MISKVPRAGWFLMIVAIAVSRFRVGNATTAGFFVLSVLGLGERLVVPNRTGLVTALTSANLNKDMIQPSNGTGWLFRANR